MLKPQIVDLGTAVLVGAMLFTASGARAETASVSYRPVELTTEAGAQAVFNRIRTATVKGCRENPLGQISDCRRELAAQIIGKINHPRLLALWNGGNRGVQLASRGK